MVLCIHSHYYNISLQNKTKPQAHKLVVFIKVRKSVVHRLKQARKKCKFIWKSGQKKCGIMLKSEANLCIEQQ